jgi:hypothetical protein
MFSKLFPEDGFRLSSMLVWDNALTRLAIELAPQMNIQRCKARQESGL